MKLTAVLLFLALSFTAFAGDIPIKINDTLTLRKDVTPDKMVASISVTNKSETYKASAVQMEKIAAIVKAHADTCTFNSYYVSPQYTYVDKKRVTTGYQGSMSIPCEFTDMKEYDAILNDIESVTSSGKGFEMSQSRVRWSVSTEKLRAEKSALKDNLIAAIKAKADTYSEATDKKCMLNIVTFQGASNDVPIEFAPITRSANALKTTAPDQSNEEIRVSANFTLVCR